ncbi:MAG: acylphosphatase [Bacteroidales bacterium]
MVYGRVQGVNYRYSAKNSAQSLGISGFAKNMPDGSVYIEAEGSDDALDTFIEWCRQGPPMANVSRITTEQTDPFGHEGFQIL